MHHELVSLPRATNWAHGKCTEPHRHEVKALAVGGSEGVPVVDTEELNVFATVDLDGAPASPNSTAPDGVVDVEREPKTQRRAKKIAKQGRYTGKHKCD